MSPQQKDGPSADTGSGNPSPFNQDSGQTRLVIESITKDIERTKDAVEKLVDGRASDFKYTVTIYAGGFLLLAGMIIVAYLLLDGKLTSLKESSIRVDTKLEELLKRIPPSPLAPAKP